MTREKVSNVVSTLLDVTLSCGPLSHIGFGFQNGLGSRGKMHFSSVDSPDTGNATLNIFLGVRGV